MPEVQRYARRFFHETPRVGHTIGRAIFHTLCFVGAFPLPRSLQQLLQTLFMVLHGVQLSVVFVVAPREGNGPYLVVNFRVSVNGKWH